jgi:exosortase E/protease (VPEID-CTERM system)
MLSINRIRALLEMSVPHIKISMAARVVILCAVLLGEKTLLNFFVDFDLAQAAHGFGALLRASQHLGFRFMVAFAAAVALFSHVRGGEDLAAASSAIGSAPLRLRWFLLHLALVAALAPLSFALYRYAATDLSLAAVASLWVLVAVLALCAVLRALAPLHLWRDAARALGDNWRYGAAAALLGTAAMQLSQMLWRPTAALTFWLVRRLLVPIVPELAHASSIDLDALVLSTHRFAVQVSDKCSGLEGVSLILAFCTVWLIFLRSEYIFPRALILMPIGVIAIFILNILRLAALFLIGNAGFPDVAVYGFHSQAGWIAFIAVACGLVLLSRRSAWMNRAARHPAEIVAYNPTAAYLMPLLAVLAAGFVSAAFSSDFEYLYSLRVIAGGMVLVAYRAELRAIDWSWSWRAPVTGIAVFLIWIVAAKLLISGHAMPDKLAMMPGGLRTAWIAARIAGAVLIVPIAEELAYRGFLMRRLIDANFESVPYSGVHALALMATSLVFGLAHGALWAPGIIAGLLFGGICIRRGALGEAVVAHAVANALLTVCVLVGGQWQFW